jgi:hypothetical protein
MILDLSEIEYVNFNERDVEVPALLSFLSKVGEISSILDVGGNYSWYTYASKVRHFLPKTEYTVVDLLPDTETEKLVDRFVVGEAEPLLEVNKFDVVFSISVLEHVGIKPLRSENPVQDRMNLVTSICLASEKGVFLSFPFGEEGEYPGQYANVTYEELLDIGQFANRAEFLFSTQFFFNPFPQGRELWSEIKVDEASRIKLNEKLGVQCVCLATLVRPGK